MDQDPRYQLKTDKDAWLLPTNYEYESTFELNTMAFVFTEFLSHLWIDDKNPLKSFISVILTT